MNIEISVTPIVLSSITGLVTYIMFKTGIFSRFFRKVDAGSARHGGELVAEVLKAHKVKHIFCLSGGHISPILVAAEKQAIRVVDVRHEVTSVFAADAVARMSGQIGVAVVTAGPGVTNTVTAVKNAQMAESPVLLMGGAAAGILKDRGALQDIDQLSLFKSLCKFTATVSRVRDIVPTLRKAIQVAQSGTPGPVFVEFPIDTLYPYNLVQREIGQKDQSKGFVGKIVNMYLNHYLFNLFGDAFEPTDTSPLKVNVQEPSRGHVDQTCEMIRSAKRPVFVLGSQTTLPPVSASDTAENLKTIGIPCFLGGMCRGMLGRHSNIQVRQRRRDALREADLIILAGAVCDFRLSYGRSLNRRAKIVAINRDRQQLYKNSDMFWKPTVAIQADVGTTIQRIARGLKDYSCPKEWIDALHQRDEEKEETNARKALEPTKIHLNPVKILLEAEEVIDDNAIMVADGGDFVGTAAYILRPRGPLTWLDPGAFGTLGVGGGFALGAKLSRPDSDVWIIYGDGSLGYSVAEFDTFARHELPCVALVGNDACWTQISREQVPLFGSNVACQLEYTDYHVVADGYGGKGYLLDRSKDDEIKEVLTEAQKFARINKKPVLINCLIGKSDFREGSISV